mgnify:CR=1 FL=1|jgi:hypothetical protein
MTYQTVAQNLIGLYANYVEVSTRNEEDYTDFSDDLVIAIEALLIRADQEKMKTMEQQAVSQLSDVTSTPSPSVRDILDQGLNLSEII